MATCYTSSGCNRTPHAADWGNNDLICYAACRAVAIYHPQAPAKVLHTLPGHTDRINCCRWIKHPDKGKGLECELVSASTDKTIIVWQRAVSTEEWQAGCTLKGHTGTVTVAQGIYVPNNQRQSSDHFKAHTFVASASVDSTVKIWERKESTDTFSCKQSISFGTGFCLDLSWIILPNTSVPMLACGGDDQRIHLFVEHQGQFVSCQTLHGHEDWIRGLDFTSADNGDVLLASCAQDCYIRIWRISPRDPSKLVTNTSISVLSLEDEIRLKEDTFIFEVNDTKLCYAVTLESVLHGHDNWVYSIRWQPSEITEGKMHQPMCLLSASMDKTMILWKPDQDAGVWVEHMRVGEVGGNTLGFYGGIFSPDGKSVLSHGFQGAFYVWHQQEDGLSWLPEVTTGGHFDSVQDIDWDPAGQFLLSASSDQTTRLHAYWQADDPKQSGWHEIARPQVHGYDLQCLAMINQHTFASGADEKVARVFGATKNFTENFARICKAELKEKGAYDIPEGASVPALGLSNKAVYQGETQQYVPSQGSQIEANPNSQYPEIYFSPLTISEPPTEDNLLQNTLWPELQKLYGHGYEIFSMAAHPDGSLLATACKASKVDHAFIILWDVATWKQICQLKSHSLTITQMSFSHSGTHLLSVSRDRTWSLFKHKDAGSAEGGPSYQRVAHTDKTCAIHSRIIWGCAWSSDDKYFITVSRDKKAVIWGVLHEEDSKHSCLANYGACSAALDLPDSATAVDFAPKIINSNRYVIAVGLNNGIIQIHTWSCLTPQNKESWNVIHTFDQRAAHHLAVKRLKFRPLYEKVVSEKSSVQLASCGADHMVKIYNIELKQDCK